MLDLSYLLKDDVQPSPLKSTVPPTSGDLDQAYAAYLANLRALNPNGTAMKAEEFERYSLGSDWLSGLKEVAKKVVQTCRLMVGVHDYEYYVDHMRRIHPNEVPMSREAFYRYCLDARFPSSGEAARNRCPC